MTLVNESQFDRGIRAIGGIVLLFFGWVFQSTSVGVALVVLGSMALATGIVGWCPAYSLFGISTTKKHAARCPHCEAGPGTS